jgi:pimeloyl-ACP methyl ester carboxylesterase
MSLPVATSATIGDGVTEQAFAFTVDNATVKGTLAKPEIHADTGIVFVHGWSGNRTGPHGLLTAVARSAAVNGYPSLRFDFRGRGESEGDGLQSTLVTMADDLVAAARVLLAQTGVRRLVYVGLCSGGNVTIGALKRLPRADGLVLLSVYPFSDGDAFGATFTAPGTMPRYTGTKPDRKRPGPALSKAIFTSLRF